MHIKHVIMFWWIDRRRKKTGFYEKGKCLFKCDSSKAFFYFTVIRWRITFLSIGKKWRNSLLYTIYSTNIYLYYICFVDKYEYKLYYLFTTVLVVWLSFELDKIIETNCLNHTVEINEQMECVNPSFYINFKK